MYKTFTQAVISTKNKAHKLCISWLSPLKHVIHFSLFIKLCSKMQSYDALIYMILFCFSELVKLVNKSHDIQVLSYDQREI